MTTESAMSSASKIDTLKTLQADILRMQGYQPAKSGAPDTRLGPIKEAFPGGSFPTAAVHEFLPAHAEDTAAVGGFIAALLSALTDGRGIAVWIGGAPAVFPPGLKSFGLDPDRLIFVHAQKEKDALWAMDEALKCDALSAVVAETRCLDFTTSRRLQLAVEQSRATGFIIRPPARNLNPTACVSRWKITSLPSEPVDDMPGVGFPKWRAELMRIRNGKPGTWDVLWIDGRFASLPSWHGKIHLADKKTM